MKVVVRCEDCVGYGYVESKNMSSALTIDCGACDGSGELTYIETYDNLYEAEQDYKDCNIIRIEDK
jgi:DnaJ-class molecular chaperone